MSGASRRLCRRTGHGRPARRGSPAPPASPWSRGPRPRPPAPAADDDQFAWGSSGRLGGPAPPTGCPPRSLPFALLRLRLPASPGVWTIVLSHPPPELPHGEGPLLPRAPRTALDAALRPPTHRRLRRPLPRRRRGDRRRLPRPAARPSDRGSGAGPRRALARGGAGAPAPGIAAHRLNASAPAYISPWARKLTTSSPATRKWSWTAMFSARAASTICRVTTMSACEGAGLPVGWLWVRQQPLALSSRARRTTSRG